MKSQYHILNGDALKVQFPEVLKGNIIVARECLIGDVQGKNLEQFFHTRAQFISNFEDYNYDDYFQDTVSEFEKIRAIPENAVINLWFEDDLFCQVNFKADSHVSRYNRYFFKPHSERNC